MQAEQIEDMDGCVVDQKLPYLYMCSNACMLAANLCMHVAHVFQELKIFMWHSIKRTETSGVKMVSTRTSRDVGIVPPIK